MALAPGTVKMVGATWVAAPATEPAAGTDEVAVTVTLGEAVTTTYATHTLFQEVPDGQQMEIRTPFP